MADTLKENFQNKLTNKIIKLIKFNRKQKNK